MDNKRQQQVEQKKIVDLPAKVEAKEVIQSSTANKNLVDTPVEKLSPLETFGKTVEEMKEAIATATQTGIAAMETAAEIAEAAREQTYQLLTDTTQRAGQAITFITSNRILRRVTGFLKLDWLLGAVDRVDVVKAEAAVKKLQQEHPNETPSQIAHRIMVDKSIYAGGMGFVTSLVPAEAIALLAVDLATTTFIQAEMVYQIAAAYGLDLQDPARKGEVLAIFGLGLGGSRVVKAGLGLLRTVPVAGALIGASANATMLYSLGYAACRFYEVKLNGSTSEAKLAEVKEASENYLEVAVAQQAVMDQILVHMILASHPEKSWQEILPSLQTLNLSPSSVGVITTHIKSPQPLDTLLKSLNRDFAFPLLAQCYRIAQLDGVTTSAEMKVIEAIATKFHIELNSIKLAVQSGTSLT